MSETEDELNLYRIISFERLVDIFKKEELFFAHPSSWEDPYETRLIHKKSNLFFAQCWCKYGVSDAMWRIYSPDKLSVRIRTTREKLATQLNDAKVWLDFDYLIEDVKYPFKVDLEKESQEILAKLNRKFNSKVAASCLFLKRRAFKHEAEVRAIIYDKSSKKLADNKAGFLVPVDPNRLITSILFDPRSPDAYVNAFRHYLKDEIGFSGPVNKSTLYAGPEPLEVM